MKWIAAVDYRRGDGHVRRREPCQDYGKLEHLGELVIGAIADGSGSQPHSDIGAKTAVRAALAHLKLHQKSLRHLFTACDAELSRALFADLLNGARDALEAEARQRRAPVEALATTLIAFVAGPKGMAAMQLGDGFIVIRGRVQQYRLLFLPDRSDGARDGDGDGDGRCLTEPAAEAVMQTALVMEPPEFLAAGTGALEPFSIRPPDLSPHAPFFKPLDHFAEQAPDDGEVHRAIRTFLRSDRMIGSAEEDATLLICRRREEQPLPLFAAASR